MTQNLTIPPQLLELLKVYYEEWRFRQENLWKRITQFFILIFFVSTFPISVHAFPNVSIPKSFPFEIFPILGILLTIFFEWFCLCESIRIKTIDKKIKLIISDYYLDKYQKGVLEPLFDRWGYTPKIFSIRMSNWVPTFLALIELTVAVTMMILILNKAI